MRLRKRHRWPPFVWVHLLVLGFCHEILSANGQCFGGIETYEKTSGTNVLCDSDCTSQGLLSQPDTSVTRDCIAICKQTSSCVSFTVDYLNSRCQSYSIDTETSNGRRQLQADSGVNFFEKVCLRGVRQSQFDSLCNAERGWAFERTVGGMLEGFDHKEIRNIESRAECERLCLLEEEFSCRSAEFSGISRTCVLSRDDRRTQPEAFRINQGSNVDYIENQCTKNLPDCSYTSSGQDVTVVAMDDILYSRTVQDCERFCDDARAFNCRSFSQKDDRCYLSGDDGVTLKNVPQPTELGAVYKEKICTRNTCDGGMFTYEKTTASFLRTARQENLPLSSNTPGITAECSRLCVDLGADCPSFSIDYNGQRCFTLDRNTQGRGDDLMPRDGQNYFEKICLRGKVDKCREKVWAFERVLGKKLEGFDEKIINQVANRRDCEELCLKESSFICLSADYNIVSLTCILSRETRRSKPGNFRDSRDTEYLENGCLDTKELTCPYKRTDNAYPRYLDTIISRVTDEITCEKQCTFFEDFVCRSFAFYASASQCFISGDDLVSAAKGALQSRPGTDYFERNCQEEYVADSENAIPDTDSHQTSQTLPQERRCTFGKLEYEKTTGYELIRAKPYRLFSKREGGITSTCTSRCQADSRCQGFNMDYNRNECQAVLENSEENLFNLRPSTGVAFFEAICLRGRTCGSVWTFERYIDYELRGFIRDTHRDISKTECEDLCLSESRFSCKSASYDHLRKECHLSEEDRFTRSEGFVVRQGSDYLENQCESRQTRCEYTPQTRDQYLIYTDKSLESFSDASCRQFCTQERDFNCRSYSFLGETRLGTSQCLLSGDTAQSAGGNAFQISTGSLYAEKDCGRQPGPTDDREMTRRPIGLQQSNNRPFLDKLPQTQVNTVYQGGGTNNVDEVDPSRCVDSGFQSSFEKVIDYTYDRGTKEQITTNADIGIATTCLEDCARKGKDCLSVTHQNERGGRQRCFAIDSSASKDQTDPQSATGVTYYEKICVRRSCGKSWMFTRVPQYEFVGDATEEVRDVQSLGACRDLCLITSNYVCRSATFTLNSRTCKLSTEDRRSAPTSFRPAPRGTDYIENECAELLPNCEYIDQPGTYLPFTDTYISNINDLEGCRSECSSVKDYNCRSFNFNSARNECFLSADDSVSLPTGLQNDRDFTFSERAGCNNVKVECTPADMLVTLSFGQEFNGRIYATGNPQSCFELGSSQSEMTLRIPIGTQCGTVQSGRGRYVNHVVIQANPVIMQDTDKTVRVECAFTADDQTVSFRPTGGGREDGGGISVTVPFQPTGTNIVTNTAPTPGVRMRVVRRSGSTADVVGLGEDLQLRIEIDQESAFGLFARNLEARTDNGELLNLIDSTGCPINELIFPALTLEGDQSKALVADFKAFRFPSTPTVNFVATVQFCQDICDPVKCSGNLDSYGRRKRREVANETLDNVIREVTAATELESLESLSAERLLSPASAPQPNVTDGGKSGKSYDNSGKVLPEHLLLGLRLTVGEDVLTKPRPPSKLGGGHFRDLKQQQQQQQQQEEEPGHENYYPSSSFIGYELGDPNYVCSPQSTIIAVVTIFVFLNIGFVAGFLFFYRMKKKHWIKTLQVENHRTLDQPPPLPPHHPRSGAVFSQEGGQDVMFKSTYDNNGRGTNRFKGNPTLANMSRQNQDNFGP